MEIGLFQLENLFHNPSRFFFFDLRSERRPVAETVDPLLARAMPIEPADLHDHLKAQNTPLEFPILLVCEDGRTSAEKARELEAAGFGNIYVVTGGVTGLLSEL